MVLFEANQVFRQITDSEVRGARRTFVRRFQPSIRTHEYPNEDNKKKQSRLAIGWAWLVPSLYECVHESAKMGAATRLENHPLPYKRLVAVLSRFRPCQVRWCCLRHS